MCQDERDDPGYDIESQEQFCTLPTPKVHGFLLISGHDELGDERIAASTVARLVVLHHKACPFMLST